MRRRKFPFSDWAGDQVVLILGPVLVSVVLFVLYAVGLLSIGWPALLGVVLLVNLAGDVAYALKNEYSVKHRRVPLCNDLLGRRGAAESEFAVHGGGYKGTVLVSGERWQAASDTRIRAGAGVQVTDRRGLVLVVAPVLDQ